MTTVHTDFFLNQLRPRSTIRCCISVFHCKSKSNNYVCMENTLQMLHLCGFFFDCEAGRISVLKWVRNSPPSWRGSGFKAVDCFVSQTHTHRCQRTTEPGALGKRRRSRRRCGERSLRRGSRRQRGSSATCSRSTSAAHSPASVCATLWLVGGGGFPPCSSTQS